MLLPFSVAIGTGVSAFGPWDMSCSTTAWPRADLPAPGDLLGDLRQQTSCGLCCCCCCEPGACLSRLGAQMRLCCAGVGYTCLWGRLSL